MSERITVPRGAQQSEASSESSFDRAKSRSHTLQPSSSGSSSARTRNASSSPDDLRDRAEQLGHEFSRIPLWPSHEQNVEPPIQRHTGAGHPIPASVRAPMERAFDADFTDVRLHTDAEADRMGDTIGARAFTHGENIFFRRRFAPGSGEGRELLAHELTHVVQNRRSGGKHEGRAVSRTSDESEREARLNARHVTAGRRATVRAMPGSMLQRGEEENKKLLEEFFQFIAENFSKKAFIDAMIKLHPNTEKWGSVQEGISQLYDERYAEVESGAKGVDVKLETAEYKKELGRYATIARRLLQQEATKQGEYVTTNADDSKDLQLTLPGEEEDVLGHYEKIASLANIKGVKLMPGSKLSQESAANLLSNYILAGELTPNREIHRIAPIDVKKGKGLFDPDIPIYGHIVFNLHEDGFVWIKVIQDKDIEKTKAIPGTEAYKEQNEQAKIEMLKQKIAADYELSYVNEKDPAKWTVEELEKLHGALSRVPGNDRSAIRGLGFVRVKALDEKDPTGRTLGAFVTDPDNRRILLADGTFDRDLHSFVGSGRKQKAAPVSYQTILHEVGHAVAAEKMLDALAELGSFDRRLDQERKRLHALESKAPKPQVGLFEDNADESQQSDLQFEAIKLKMFQGGALADNLKKALAIAKVKPEQDFVSELISWFSAVGKALDSSSEENIKAVQFAKENTGQLWNAVENEEPYKAVLAEFKAYYQQAGKIIKAQYELAGKSEEIAKKKEELALKKKQDEEAQRKHEEEVNPVRVKVKELQEKTTLASDKYKSESWGGKKGYSKRVENFVTFITQAGLAPKLTAYAQSSWNEDNPEEFFAEAYSLWLNDPDYMRENLLPLYLWFEKGFHAK